jgi:hypothetical protein
LEDPTLSLLRITIEEAEYWDSPNSKLVQIVGFVKALATGERADGGEYGRVSL